VATLDQTGLLHNTIVIFASDNGGLMSKTSNAPLRNGKAFLYEGGVRVPLIVWVPGRVKGPNWCDVPVHATDLLPTMAALAGVPIKHRIDGQSLVSLLNDPANKAGGYVPKPIYWHYPFNVGLNDPETGLPLPPHSAIRKGGHKLIWDWHGRLKLFHVAQDIAEEKDLAQEEPALTRQLFSDLVTWLDSNVERRYFPTPNARYQADKDTRGYPFRDLRKELLGLTAPPGLPDAMGRNAGRP